MSHVLVTGGSGTIGTELCLRLLDRGHEVTGVDREPNRWSDAVDDQTIELDLLRAGDLSELPEDVDLIVHLAANARVYKLIESPDRARENLDTTFTVLEYARRVGADILFASSREVYGNRDKLIHEETDAYVEECESPYTASKVGGEALVKSYENCYDVESVVLRFSNVYGRYDVSDRVVPLFVAQAARDRSMTVYGERKVLDFTYIDDCVDGILAAIDHFGKATGETFNVASGRGTSLIELAETIVDVLDSDSTIEVESTRTGEVSRFIADPGKAKRVLGFDPEYDVPTGIAETVGWYEDRDIYDEILAASGW